MKRYMIAIFLIMSPMLINAVELSSGNVDTFSFTKDGFYCSSNITYNWEYAGNNPNFYKEIEENIDGVIGTSLALLFFEIVADMESSDLELKEDGNENWNEPKLNSLLLERINETIQMKFDESMRKGLVLNPFESITVKSVNAVIFDFLHSAYMPTSSCNQ